ncbi:MAG: hypothetical protein A2W19_07505 [Spirochaetes bacterium RBG_16_49_21]|nr:MAG: hypothetical protein A2W19_07505 [Spirochaetes bacterium RBG_16_49_21]
MMKIPDYAIVEKLAETQTSIIYRGRRNSNGAPALIKALNPAYPSTAAVARFKRECELIKNFDHEGIVKVHDLAQDNGSLAVILEDFEGVPLKEILRQKRIDIEQCLRIGTQLADTLGHLHSENIIHGDINPGHILVSENTGRVKLTDFGISALLRNEDEDIYNPVVIEDTLAYLSPEQTGRMNRSVDYRTDLYSLGIVFYEMLTGNPPFKSSDPLEVIHSHLARNPAYPSGLDPKIPEALSDITMKLVQKMAEKRYQNGFGLLLDLNACLDQLEKTGRIERFKIARNDVAIRFIIPQTVYGREKEIGILMSAFGQAGRGGREILIISGQPGIGKTTIINEIHKPVVANRGYFISGKYDRFRRDVPYSAIIQAFQSLVDRILTESEQGIRLWREKLLQTLGPNGGLITSVIPRLGLIIGRQAGPDESEGVETENLFNNVFRGFVSVFAKREHPLVLCLDDMQWADAASLSLVQDMATDPDIKYFLLILSYRDNEVNDSHPFTGTLEGIKKRGTPATRIAVTPLDALNVNKMIHNFLRAPERKTRLLAELIYKKTNGNPFFVNQFLKAIYDGGMLALDSSRGWRWDMEEISRMQMTDNVVDLMVRTITGLPAETQEILKICACIGNRFDLETVAIVFNKSIGETLSELARAIEKDIITSAGDFYIFRHDRIHEAAYSLLSDEEKTEMHYRIGNYLLQNAKKENLFEKILYIVNQLNSGSSLITTQEDKYRFAELNIMAAEKTKRSGAFESSLRYLKKGIDIFEENIWAKKYNLALTLHTEAAVAAYRANDYEEMERFSQIVFNNARDVFDKAIAYEVLIQAASNKNNMSEAITLGLEALRLLGFRIPKNPGRFRIYIQYLKIKRHLTEKKIAALKKLPEIKDKRASEAIRIIAMLHLPTQVTMPYLYQFNVFKSYELSIKYGLTRQSGVAFASLAVILCWDFWMINTGFKLVKEAITIADTAQLSVQFIFNAMIRFRKEHLRDIGEPLFELHRGLLQAGDIQTAALALMFCSNDIYTGRELTELEKEFATHAAILTRLHVPYAYYICQIRRQLLQNLVDGPENPSRINGELFNAEKMLPVIKNINSPNLLFVVYLHEMIAAYMYGDFQYAFEKTNTADTYINYVFTSYIGTLFYFYDSLIRLAACPTMKHSQQKKILRRVTQNQKRMKYWAHAAPINYMHKFHLVEAELAGVRGGNDAADYYDKAIDGALKNQYINEAALAYELAAKYWSGKGKEIIAQTYRESALRYYSRWGAAGKVKYLKEKHPALIPDRPATAPTDLAADSATMRSAGSAILDIATIVKTSQALSTEFDLGTLLEKIMRLSITNAGAQKGSLMLENEKLRIEAAGRVDGKIEVLQSIPVEESDDLPRSVVNYAYITRENLVLNDAQSDERFASDPYIEKNRSKSILCSPIMYKGVMSGILYLENNLAAGAFTPERLELLGILSSQAAISIENSRLLAEREKAAMLTAEMKIAANIQTALLPKRPAVKGYEITGYMKPAAEVGGDYYDIINADGADWIIIGDVSGHGVTSGLVMMMALTSIHTAVKNLKGLSPSQVVEMANRVIYDNVRMLGEDRYMSITVFLLHADGAIDFSGLHQDIMIHRADSHEVEVVETEGIWLGLKPEIKGMLREDTVKLRPGDAMLMYTDGITEAWEKGSVQDERDALKNMYGDKRLAGAFKRLAPQSTAGIRDGILEELESYECADDVTMLILKRLD